MDIVLHLAGASLSSAEHEPAVAVATVDAKVLRHVAAVVGIGAGLAALDSGKTLDAAASGTACRGICAKKLSTYIARSRPLRPSKN